MASPKETRVQQDDPAHALMCSMILSVFVAAMVEPRRIELLTS